MASDSSRQDGVLILVWICLCVGGAASAADKNGVSPNTISLPSGPGSIEGLGEAFQPTLNTGTGKTAVPLALPPGTTGHAPEVVLSYEGGGGNGPLGFGWKCTVRYVQRQCDKGIPRYVDGPDQRDDDADGEIDEADEVDVFINELKEELVPQATGYYFCENESAFVRYRRVGEHWEGTLPDGTRLEFGLTPAARIEAPVVLRVGEEPATVTYRWLLERSTDTNGNTIVYSYEEREGEENLHQKYLTKIEYGPGAPPWESSHLVLLKYEKRPDPFEDGRPGFLLRSGLRVRDIIVGTRGADLGALGHAPGDLYGDGTTDYWLNRRYHLRYEAHRHWSLLSEVALIGSDDVSKLPATTFEYNVCDPPTTLSAGGAILESPSAPASVMDSADVDLIDLNGDALPDILQTREGISHRAYLNQGESTVEGEPVVSWKATFEEVSADANGGQAWSWNLEDTGRDVVHLADMDGDGLADLVYKPGDWNGASEVFYFRNQGDVSWGPRVRMASGVAPPPSPFGSPEVRTADMDFDKRIDIVEAVLVAGTVRYRVWFNLGEGRYSVPLTVRPGDYGGSPSDFEWPLFSTPGVHVRDFNGDRVPDILRVVRSGVSVNLGLGHGRFVPTFEAEFPTLRLTPEQIRAARLEDINGDGLADVILDGSSGTVSPGTIWYWINLGNRGFEKKREIIGVPRPLGPGAVVRWADLNGNGTTDYVLADRSRSSRITTVDLGRLLGCAPAANLLTKLTNGLGSGTTIDYSPSTAFAVEDAAEGKPWPHPLPFPVDVISAIRTTDSLGNLYVARFRYHDGYYDAKEKEFRGFARVEQIDVGDSTAPSLATQSHFNTGRDVEALKGKLERIITAQAVNDDFSTDAATWFTDHTTHWRTRNLMTGNDGKPVVYAFPESKTSMVLELGQGAPVLLEEEYDFDDYGNKTADRRFGLVVGGDRGASDDERFTITEFATNLDAWLVRSPKRTEIMDENGAVISRTEFFYDDESFSGGNLGDIVRGNLTLQRDWIDPDTPDAFVATKRIRYDAYGNPRCIVDPLARVQGNIDLSHGHAREIIYEGRFHAYPEREVVYLEAGKEPLEARATYDSGFGTVISSRDFNQNETTYAYDEFARLVSVVRPLDTEEYPTTEYGYVLGLRVGEDGFINFIETRQLDRERGTQPEKRDHYFINRRFIDGLGREVLRKEEAELDPASGKPRVVVSGALRFNARRSPHTELGPFYTLLPGDDLESLLAFEDVTAPGWRGLFHEDGALRALDLASAHATTTLYDATLRPVEVVNPDGTVARTVYEPLVVRSFDENDNDPQSAHAGTPGVQYTDGLGRLIRVDEVVRLEDDGRKSRDLRTWSTRYTYDLNDMLIRIEDSQGNVKVCEYDGLRRVTFMNDPDAGHRHYRYDAASNLAMTRDAKGQETVFGYDGANRLVQRNYLDRTGDPGTDPVDVVFTYDVPARDLDRGDGGAPAALRNTRGKLVTVEDLSGAEHFSFDERGRPEWQTKVIPDPVTGIPVPYTTSYAYDSMDRLTHLVYPDNDHVEYIYNARSLLETIRGGGDGAVVLAEESHTPSGQRLGQVFGNGVACSYEYDRRLRLTRLVTSGAGATSGTELLHYGYRFDAVSNITGIRDLRAHIPAGDARHNSQLLEYDDLYRLTRYQLTDAALSPDGNRGRIDYRYDRIGNILFKGSPPSGKGHIDHDDDGRTVVNLGAYDYGGGRSGRFGRDPGDPSDTADSPPGPHAVTGTASGRSYTYDDNGNMREIDGLHAEWDFLDRLVHLEGRGMEADYAYDHASRRIAKSVNRAGRPVFTLYINQYFEVRDGEEPTKYVFAGETRLARVKGTLDPTRPRVQRIRVVSDWNLVALCVEPGDSTAASVFRLGGEGSVVDRVLRAGSESYDVFTELAPSDSVEVGTPYWVHAARPDFRTIRGSYRPRVATVAIPAGKYLFGWPRLESLRVDETFFGAERLWVFDSPSAGWLLKDYTHPGPADNIRGPLPPGSGLWAFAGIQGRLQLGATADQDIVFYHADHLGSTRVVTDLAGGLIQDTAFYPFGAKRNDHRATAWFDTAYKFTAKERDIESGLQYHEARYLAPALGRFVSVDPYFLDVGNLDADATRSFLAVPQRHHLFAYSRNSPLVFVDPNGMQEKETLGEQIMGRDFDNRRYGRIRRQVTQVAPKLMSGFQGTVRIAAVDKLEDGSQMVAAWGKSAESGRFRIKIAIFPPGTEEITSGMELHMQTEKEAKQQSKRLFRRFWGRLQERVVGRLAGAILDLFTGGGRMTGEEFIRKHDGEGGMSRDKLFELMDEEGVKATDRDTVIESLGAPVQRNVFLRG